MDENDFVRMTVQAVTKMKKELDKIVVDAKKNREIAAPHAFRISQTASGHDDLIQSMIWALAERFLPAEYRMLCKIGRNTLAGIKEPLDLEASLIQAAINEATDDIKRKVV